MKRSTYILVMLILSFVAMQGQKMDDENPLYARAGFKAGASYASVFGDIDNPGGRFRMHLGALVEYPVTRKFFIQGELLYSAQGYTTEVNGEEQKVSLNFISLPIVGKFYFTDSFNLETGIQTSLLNNVRNESLADNDPFFDSFNNLDISWIIGAGYKLESGLFFQMRYNLGLTILNNDSVAAPNNRNSVAQFSIGYLFKTKYNRRIIQEEE